MGQMKSAIRHFVVSLYIAICTIPQSGAVTLAPDPTFAELEILLGNPKVTSVEKFLAELPVSYRNSFTLVYKSKSIQGASPPFPRAVVFGRDGKLILTFNGDRSQKGFNNIEILHWDEALKEWELREIQFSNTAKPRVSGPNPSHCLHCHSSAPRPYGHVKPVWNNYHRWTGVYGSVDDALYNVIDENALGRVLKTELHFVKKEADDFKAFRNSALTHDRYKYLFEGQGHDLDFPYHQNSTSELNFKLGKAPNTRLSEFLTLRTAERNVHRIFRSEIFRKYPYSLLLLSQCAHIPQAQAALNHFNGLANEIGRWGKLSDLQKVDPSAYQVFHQVVDRLGLVGIDEWNTALDTPGDQVTYPITGIRGSSPSQSVIEAEFIKKLSLNKSLPCTQTAYPSSYKNETELGLDFLNVFNANWALVQCSNVCDLAAKNSEVEIASAKPEIEKLVQESTAPRLAYKRNQERNIVMTCAACHSPASGPTIGPSIPFGDRKKLALWSDEIQRVIYPSQNSVYSDGHRMPFAQSPLTAKETQDLMDYIRN